MRALAGPPAQRLLLLRDAAQYLGISPQALKHKVLRGQVKTVKIDRRYRFDIEALDELIRSHLFTIDEFRQKTKKRAKKKRGRTHADK